MATRASHSLVKALRAVPDFAALDDHVLLAVVGASTNLFWPAGAVVFERGEPSEALYVVLAGEVAIVDGGGDGEVEVSRVGSGESFGELSLLLATRHSKTARAVEDSELMVLSRETFEDVLANSPDLAAEFRRRVEAREPVQGEVAGSV